MITAVWILLGIAVLLGVSVAVIGRDSLLEMVLGPVERTPTDFAKLRPRNRPNWYLVCPPQYCGTTPSRVSPVFDVPAAVLRARWMDIIKRQPRVSQIAVSADKLQFDYIQRSRFFHFPDTITLRLIPVGENTTTLAIFSRSHYGYSDLGVNKARVESWLAELSKAGK